jgi:hypothetical protein
MGTSCPFTLMVPGVASAVIGCASAVTADDVSSFVVVAGAISISFWCP